MTTEGSPESALDLSIVSQDPLCASAPLTHLDEWITPVERFFVRNHFSMPELDVSSWGLTLWGEVEKPLMIRYEELAQFPRRDVISLLECAGNSRSVMQPPAEGVSWDHGAVGTAQWTGVSVHTLLEQASLRPSATDVLFEGADFGKERTAPGMLAPTEGSYSMSIPLDKVLHPDTLLAFEMNGEPLPKEHGYPVRLLVPGWYGMASVKWLVNIRVLDRPFRGFHENDYYVYVPEGEAGDSLGQRVTSMRVKSLITWPRRGGVVDTGSHLVRGVAWSGAGPIARLDVSVDNGRTWGSATLEESQSPYAWQPWEFQWDVAKPGYYLLRARATDVADNTQPLLAPWNFRGYAVNSIHAVTVTVRP